VDDYMAEVMRIGWDIFFPSQKKCSSGKDLEWTCGICWHDVD